MTGVSVWRCRGEDAEHPGLGSRFLRPSVTSAQNCSGVAGSVGRDVAATNSTEPYYELSHCGVIFFTLSWSRDPVLSGFMI